MSLIIDDYVLSPLAFGTEENEQASLAGKTAIRPYDNLFGEAMPLYAAVFDKHRLSDTFPLYNDLLGRSYTFFEILSILVVEAVAERVDVASADVQFVLSSTKGNIEFLGQGRDVSLVLSAKKIAAYFGNPNPPIVISNACISGLHALIIGDRLIKRGDCKTAVVVGCDVLSTFIVTGFQCLKALSPDRCRPFDKNRAGLNLGEAAACMVLSNDSRYGDMAKGVIVQGSVHNDANHISGPSRTGEGAFRCLMDVVGNKDNIAFINLHGTATLYNDEMEAVAIHRANLQNLPVNGLKGIFGHTLGAAGILETALSLHALKNGIILPSTGFFEQGTTQKLNISNRAQTTNKTGFIKLLSGFGGTNAALQINLTAHNESDKNVFNNRRISQCDKVCYPNAGDVSEARNVDIPLTNRTFNHLLSSGERRDTFDFGKTLKTAERASLEDKKTPIEAGYKNADEIGFKIGSPQLDPNLTQQVPSPLTVARILIMPDVVKLDDKTLFTTAHNTDLITELYKQFVGDYPKFYKMDRLCQLGFVATEILLQNYPEIRFVQRSDRAIILANSSSSIFNDTNYFHTFAEPEHFFPSPSLFVYTLPNIVSGEIAIRNKYLGETAFYLLENKTMLPLLIRTTFEQKTVSSAIAGWLEYIDNCHFEADISLLTIS